MLAPPSYQPASLAGFFRGLWALGMPNLGEGFPLRCFQRLSLPNVATQRCPWRDSWFTRGSSTSVLSY